VSNDNERGPLPAYQLTSERALLLADLSSVHQDLQFVVACCDESLKLPQPPAEPSEADTASVRVISRALWAAAVVAYARCFNTGKRLPLDETLIDHFDGDPLGAHRHYIGMRDKHIAHSVNAFDEVVVAAFVGDLDDGAEGVIGVGVLSRILISDTAEGLLSLRTLAAAWSLIVGGMATDLMTELREDCQAKPLEEIRAGAPGLGLVVPSPEVVRQARTR